MLFDAFFSSELLAFFVVWDKSPYFNLTFHEFFPPTYNTVTELSKSLYFSAVNLVFKTSLPPLFLIFFRYDRLSVFVCFDIVFFLPKINIYIFSY